MVYKKGRRVNTNLVQGITEVYIGLFCEIYKQHKCHNFATIYLKKGQPKKKFGCS